MSIMSIVYGVIVLVRYDVYIVGILSHTVEELLTDELHADQDGELAAEESLTDELRHSLRLMEYLYAVLCTSLSTCPDGHCR